ncbi:MAG TPA: 3-hydroxybutyrate dehydrogenase [Brevundimonas sp.]|nr:3-hydroxybutyrate dehydrogenase [Brevundimonas sp.]
MTSFTTDDIPDLTGRRAIVTGANSGTGFETAKALAARGADVIVAARSHDRAIAAIADIKAKQPDARLRFEELDLSRQASVTAFAQRLLAEGRPIDILVNNAGMQHVAPVDEFPVDKWDKIIALNLSAAFHTIRLAVPHMKERGWGRIINTASAHSLVASPYKSAYVAAKHGIAGLTKTVALEVATTGVTVNCISPGYVWTPLVENQIPDTMKARGMSREEVIDEVLLAKQPTKKFVQPEDIGEMAVFLCRDSMANVNGANWSVDGGWTAD